SLLDFDYHEVRVKQAIIDNSRSIFLAVDHTKFGRNAMVKLGHITQAHMVFTNQQPPQEILSILNEASIPLEVIETGNMPSR
ncbi:MAG: DeoR/GlpR family transcriptional regulator, partial [Vibrio gallaecicus]